MDFQKEDFGRVIFSTKPNDGKTASALCPVGSSMAKCREAVSANSAIAKSKPRKAASAFHAPEGWGVPRKRTITTGNASNPKRATVPVPTRPAWIELARVKRSGP